MNIKNINERFKFLLKENFFGNLNESEEDYEEKIRTLVKSGHPENIELAQMTASAVGVDFDKIMNEVWDSWWFEMLDIDGSPVEKVSELLSRKALYLSSLSLKHIPESIGKFQQLNSLFLDTNQLTVLPSSLGELKNLELLWLKNNFFTDFPKQICDLASLIALDIKENFIKKIPNEIEHLSKLENLDLRHNDLLKLPDGFSNLGSLKFLHLGFNTKISIENLLEHLPNLKNLEVLNLRGNIPTIHIPKEILNTLSEFCKEREINFYI